MRIVQAFAAALFVAACAGAQDRAPLTPASQPTRGAPATPVASAPPLSAIAASPLPSAPITHASTCNRKVASSCTGTPPSFKQEIHPLLERRCFGCHANDGEAADDHDFSKFATLIAQQRSVVAEVSACAMPPAYAPAPLAEDEAALLLRWIACGARDN